MQTERRIAKCAVLAALLLLGGACTKIDAVHSDGKQTQEAVMAAASAAEVSTTAEATTAATTETTTTTVTTTVTTTTAAGLCQPFIDENANIDPSKPMVALTFDDGPSPQYTPRLLDGLKQRGVHATFFLIGQQVQDYPELVQRIRAEGHQIGNHTYDHAPLDRLSCGEAMADLSRCDGVLQELAGEGTYWVRPPYGFITEEELAAWSTPMLYWSVDTCDWECRDVQKEFAAICQARDGDVILLHDCYGTSVEAALQAIDCLSEQGVEFVTVEELFALRGQTAEAGHLSRRPE